MSESIINSRQSLDAYIAHLEAQFKKHKFLRVSLNTGKQRSLTQNRCIHLYCGQLGDALNDAGYDMKKTLKPAAEIPWTPDNAKDHLWRPIQEAVLGKKSTTKLLTTECSEVYDVLSRHISNTKGIYVPWPSIETMRKR